MDQTVFILTTRVPDEGRVTRFKVNGSVEPNVTETRVVYIAVTIGNSVETVCVQCAGFVLYSAQCARRVGGGDFMVVTRIADAYVVRTVAVGHAEAALSMRSALVSLSKNSALKNGYFTDCIYGNLVWNMQDSEL